MTQQWVVLIHDWLPTPLNRLMRGTVRNRIRLAKQDRAWIACYCHLFEVPKAQVKRRVSLKITMPGRMTDPDAYLKSTLDALKACGAIRDDSSEWVEWTMPQIERGRRRVTEITISEVKP